MTERLATTELLLIRHGRTALAGTLCGQSDPHLDAEGRLQAEQLAVQLAAESLDAVVSSDLERARATAEPLALGHGLPIDARPGLREIGFGEWEALRWAEIEQRDPEYARRWMEQFPRLPAPGGEVYEDFRTRVRAEYAYLLQSGHRRIAVVTHGGVLRVLLACQAGRSEPDAWAMTLDYGCCLRLHAGASSQYIMEAAERT